MKNYTISNQSSIQESTKSSISHQVQLSPYASGAVGGLTVLFGGRRFILIKLFDDFISVSGYAWYCLSGTRKVVVAARSALDSAENLQKKVKQVTDNPGNSAAVTIEYLRSATTTLIPGSAAFLEPIFKQIEQISKEHGDQVKKIFEETYKDLEELGKNATLDSQTALKAVEILQKRVKQLQDLATDVKSDFYNQLVTENPKLKDQIAENYNKLKELIEKGKEKKPEVENIFKEASNELMQHFKKNGINEKSIKAAQELLKAKAEEVKHLLEDISKDIKKM